MVFGDYLKCHWLIAKWNWNLSSQITVFFASGNDNSDADANNIFFTSKNKKLLLLYQQKITKNYQNFLAKDLRDQCIRMNIKQKVKVCQTSIDIFLRQTL